MCSVVRLRLSHITVNLDPPPGCCRLSRVDDRCVRLDAGDTTRHVVTKIFSPRGDDSKTDIVILQLSSITVTGQTLDSKTQIWLTPWIDRPRAPTSLACHAYFWGNKQKITREEIPSHDARSLFSTAPLLSPCYSY